MICPTKATVFSMVCLTKVHNNIVIIFVGGIYMASNNKMKSTRNNKNEDGKFRSKHIKHDPQAESARAVFGLKDNNSKDKD